jgi:hypothetical protein
MKENYHFFIKLVLTVSLVLSSILPSIATAEGITEGSAQQKGSFELPELREQVSKKLLEEAIAELKVLPYPNHDEQPQPNERIELAIIALEEAIDGTFETENTVNSVKVFEKSIMAIDQINLYYNHPHSTDEYKVMINEIIKKIVEANRIIAIDALNDLETDISKYPNKYKHLLKNAFKFYENADTFTDENNQKQNVHFYKKAWEEANAIIQEGKAIFDTDADGIDDYIEKELGLKTNKADTDGDGLLDGYELYVSFTDPLSTDSDQNGTLDGDEDTDSDGLTNLQEQEHGSNPWFPDTDFDGLTDSFEVNEFHSSPLLVDTDHD